MKELYPQQPHPLHARKLFYGFNQRALFFFRHVVQIDDGNGDIPARTVDQIGDIQPKARDGGGNRTEHIRHVFMDAEKARLAGERARTSSRLSTPFSKTTSC